MARSEVDIFETEDDIPDGWYLHRFGDGQKMVICLQPTSYIGRNICKSRIISNEHVLLQLLNDGTWYIRDLKSKHGTYVNDEIIPEEGMVLEEWDVICLGRKRPRNENDFGFMLKFKETVNSDSTEKANNGSSTSERDVKLIVKQETSQSVSKDNSPSLILISDDSCEDDQSGFDSDRTVKFSSSTPVEKLSAQVETKEKNVAHDPPVLQQKTDSVQEKIGNWLSKNETPFKHTSWRSKRKRLRKQAKKHYVDSDGNSSDTTSSSKTSYRPYNTRPKEGDSDVQKNVQSALLSEYSFSSDSDSEHSDSSNSNTSSKRQKLSSYYDDKPYIPNS